LTGLFLALQKKDLISLYATGKRSATENVMTNKRDIFAELTEEFDALKAEREGKLTLRTFEAESKPAQGLIDTTRCDSCARINVLVAHGVYSPRWESTNLTGLPRG
jgi:hypothetical protein